MLGPPGTLIPKLDRAVPQAYRPAAAGNGHCEQDGEDKQNAKAAKPQNLSHEP
jgi:hypothetical protein